VPWRDWVRTVEIEPSLYAADFSRLGEQIEVLLRAGARVFHFDVGDGHFVPPVTMGPIVLKWIAPMILEHDGAVDCHLMVENPERHFEAIREAGGSSVTFHYEATDDPQGVAAHAREQGLEVGLAFNPETSPEDAASAADTSTACVNPGTNTDGSRSPKKSSSHPSRFSSAGDGAASSSSPPRRRSRSRRPAARSGRVIRQLLEFSYSSRNRASSAAAARLPW